MYPNFSVCSSQGLVAENGPSFVLMDMSLIFNGACGLLVMMCNGDAMGVTTVINMVDNDADIRSMMVMVIMMMMVMMLMVTMRLC